MPTEPLSIHSLYNAGVTQESKPSRACKASCTPAFHVFHPSLNVGILSGLRSLPHTTREQGHSHHLTHLRSRWAGLFNLSLTLCNTTTIWPAAISRRRRVIGSRRISIVQRLEETTTHTLRPRHIGTTHKGISSSASRTATKESPKEQFSVLLLRMSAVCKERQAECLSPLTWINWAKCSTGAEPHEQTEARQSQSPPIQTEKTGERLKSSFMLKYRLTPSSISGQHPKGKP